MGEKFERTPVRVVLSDGQIRYEVRATVYLDGKREASQATVQNSF